MLSSRLVLRFAATILCPVALLAACGDDDETAGTNESSGRSDEANTAFCDASLAIELAPEPEIDVESADEAEIVAAVREFATEVMRPLADDIVAAAPSAISAQAAVLSDAVDDLAGGDLQAMDHEDVQAAGEAFDAFVDDECGWTSVALTATDYAFDGVPANISAGPTRFQLANDGVEAHELLVVRRGPGVDQSVTELLALGTEEVFDLIEPIGNPAFALSGGVESVVLDLRPGSYIALCLIPVGVVDQGSVPAAGVPPHAAEGMTAEFVVS